MEVGRLTRRGLLLSGEEVVALPPGIWWVGQARGRNHFFAMGWGGQFIVCVPDFNLVVVATCKWQGVSNEQARQNWYDIFVIIIENILPAVKH